MADEERDPDLEDLPADDEPSPDSEGDGDEDEDGADPSDDAEDGESEDDPDADEAPEEDPDAGLPKGVRRRIDTLTAKRRAAERRAEASEAECARLRKLCGADDPKAILDVARRHGILPDLLGADEAKGLADLERREGRLSVIRDALDDLEDSGEGEVELGGKRYTAGQLRKLCRQTERDVEELREAYGELRKSLSARIAKLLRLGLAAEKEATRAGKRKPAGRKARQARTAREEDPEELDDLPRRPRPERGASRREPGEGGAEDRGMSARERLRRMTMDIARGAGRRRA